jgi:hypothetical protein
MKARTTEATEGNPFENFDRLFRAVTSVPKSEVEKLEARERIKNRRSRAQKKAARLREAAKNKP